MSIKDRGARALTTPLKRRRRTPASLSSASLPRRHAATATATATPTDDDLGELAPTTFSGSYTPAYKGNDFDPAENAKKRRGQLPPSRYQPRPPRYYRGPLHPHQPPRPSDPSSREFIPGPFSLPRLEQTYHTTIAPDMLALHYTHYPPGYSPPPKAPRLRAWDGSSPYHKNRPLRGPRGGDVLNLLKRRITFRNIPKLEGIIVHSFIKQALEDSGPLHVASMALQAITGARCTTHKVKHNEVRWGLREGKVASLTTELKGEEMYHFLGKMVDVVLPRVRDWKGVKGSSGDDNGNLSFGLSAEMVALFPEIEVNYDAYPPKLIPGCHITIQTSATTDRDARLLLTALGIPFQGKFVN